MGEGEGGREGGRNEGFILSVCIITITWLIEGYIMEGYKVN